MKVINKQSYAIKLIGFNCKPRETNVSKAHFCKHCLSPNVCMYSVSQHTWELRGEYTICFVKISVVMHNFHVNGKGLFCNSVKYNNMLYAIKTLKNLNSMLQPTNTAFLCRYHLHTKSKKKIYKDNIKIVT